MSDSRQELPTDLQRDLKELGADLATFHVSLDVLARVLRQFGALPVEKIAKLDGEIAAAGKLFVFYGEHIGDHSLPNPLREFLERRGVLPEPKRSITKIEKEQMFHQLLQVEPDLEFLFLFHRNGYLRQAALDKLDAPLPNGFFLAALAYRLNDWVPQVSAAAAGCLARVLPKTEREIIAKAAIGLMDRAFHWRRWGAEAEILEQAFSQADVVPLIASILREAKTGPMGRTLGLALRWPLLDEHISDLSKNAVMPAVRGRALRVLLDGRATWHIGYEKQMVNPYHRIIRRVPSFQSRSVMRSEPLEAIIHQGALDRSPAVRKVAATALVQNRQTLANRDEIIALLKDDRSPSVRSAIEFVVRKLKEEAASSSLASS
ncbi:hypothetical protein ACFSM5_00590 [Lacibacterium aquatile]|uniref:HEAT repeat domain-containing protein n=1 Tax=Lacibacterium aquatile TaxID=1168082 RepID=A0ABW5DLK5_9PROT